MDLNDCKGGNTSSDNARARARLSYLRSKIGPAMRSDEYVLMRWRDTDGSMRRERVVPVAWKSRTELRTACGTIIDMNKIEEICDIAGDAVDEINSLVERLHMLATEIQVLQDRVEQMEIDKDLSEHGF